MCPPIERSLIAVARRLGLEDIRIERSRRHPLLRASLQGDPCISYVFPRTPSDWRSELNAVQGLRRMVRRACEARGIPTPGAKLKASAGSAQQHRARSRTARRVRLRAQAAPIDDQASRLDKDPWSDLAKLRELLLAACTANTEEPSNEPNLLYAGAAERARRNGQW